TMTATVREIETYTTTYTMTATVREIETYTTTYTMTATVREIDWATTIALVVVMLVVGVAIGYIIKRK
ncbi:MAG: hypothetical protein QXR23_08785, partial [Ignisphaera sp.]